MSLASLLATRQVTIQPYAAGAADGYGNIAGTWGTGTLVSGWIDQTSSTEQLQSEDRTVTSWQLYLPAGTTISVLDRVVDDAGRLFEVSGEPDIPFTPRGPHHVVVALRRVSG